MNSELRGKILENDMIWLSGGESDVDLLGPDVGLGLEEDLDTTKPYSIIDELMDSPPTHHTKYQHSTNTITFINSLPFLTHYLPWPPLQHSLL